ncbi:MAG TPA: response regulator transcription factor [Gemmatimonadales bacterium]|jgi:two-component system NarL family response regulator|nr:response regulator transcription factor [Gemmatimonadales bacterium]
MTEPTAPVRVLIADDHLLFRDGLAVLLQRQPGIDVIAVAANGTEALESCRSLLPDVVLVDLRMPETDGIALIGALHAACPQVRAIVLSGFDADDDVVRAIRAGARGYLLKTTYPGELAEAIHAVYRGETWLPPAVAAKLATSVGRPRLTQRQGEVLGLIAHGLTNEEIGNRLNIVEGTVKAHVKSILEKLGARDRTQALCIALQRGLVRSA